MTINPTDKDPIVSYNNASDDPPTPDRPEFTNEVTKKPSPPSSSSNKMLKALKTSPIVIVTPDIVLPDPSVGLGVGDGFGNGMGGDGKGFKGNPDSIMPRTFGKRCSRQDRIHRIKSQGGDEAYEDAVVKSLRFIQKTQNKDGSWTKTKPVAMTGLSLLAYLGHCETPLSAEFGESVQDAIVYLINVGQKNEGNLATTTTDKHWIYEHAIATYALAEAYTLCKQDNIALPYLEETITRAASIIIANQHSTSGGWDYAYDTTGTRGGDTSITCWHLQALKACKLTKLEIPGLKKCAARGINYLVSCENGKGTFGYQGKRNLAFGPTMTPAAALCFQQWGRANRSSTKNAIKWSTENNQFDYKTMADLYQHYYTSQAMMNAGGKHWATYNGKTIPSLFEAQNQNGSWPAPAGNIPTAANYTTAPHAEHLRTCLATLMLEVYYRFLPSSE